MCRTTDLKTESQVSSVISGLLDLFADTDIYEINFVALRKALEGSDVTLPATWTGNTQWGTGSAVDNDNRAKTFSFTGRDDSGHKVKAFVFGAKFVANGDYRVQVGENAEIDSIVAYLGALNGFFLTINGSPAIWNQYANVGFNDHWIRVARG